MNSVRRVVILLIASMLLLVACGDGGGHEGHGGASTSAPVDASQVNIAMRDIAFSPDTVDVEQGSTLTFRFKNEGQVVHDAVLGDEMAQADHEAQMRAGAAADHHMGGGNAITVEPGKEGELTYTFNEAGTFLIGCHEPGHYDAGMKVTVNVT